MRKYVHNRETHNLNAPKEIVPFIMELFNPKSVIDVGCGLGSWLHVFRENGVKTIFGIDGPHLENSLLYIEDNLILRQDLESEITINKKFDLAISLEVAEHLGENSSDIFIKSLTRLSDKIIFSAAIPNQIGGQNHLNEQWPDYWQQKFNNLGFSCKDVFREKFWGNTKIEWWYQQNIFLAFKSDKASFNSDNTNIRSYIHPDLYKSAILKIENLHAGKIEFNIALNIFTKSIFYSLRVLLKTILKTYK
ncbi:MAG: methyltransferase domain-containing protein [Bacteroidales bacterium]|nr:methyltransferase domain-containing protein [Bacteroidales bacterium]